MQIGLAIAHLLLARLSRWVVASPEVLRVVRVWEHVVIFDGPADVLGVSLVKELAWRGVQQRDVGLVVFVEVVNQPIHLLKI
jgi:hypothetical protein